MCKPCIIKWLSRISSIDKLNVRPIFATMLWYQKIPLWFQKLFPGKTWRKETKQKAVYLTFDDGPHPEITDWVITALNKHGMKGTFFCVGDNARKYPEVLEKLKQNGHALGNHTMHHLKGWQTTKDVYLKDVEMCAKYVDSTLFRPPYGRISRSQSKAIEKNYQIIMWNLLSCDFNPKLNRQKALEGLMRKTSNGSIIVFHDSEKAEQNLKFMLPPYLDYLNQNGYTCNTLFS